MAGDPSTMFGQLPQMDSGPMSGYLRGVGANYGMAQQDASLEQQGIANRTKQLELDQLTKGVPLQDATRANELSQQGLNAEDIASGLTGELQRGTKQTGIINNATKMQTSQLEQIINQAKFWEQADAVMSSTKDPAKWQENWDNLKAMGKAMGVKNIDEWVSRDVIANAHAKAAAAPQVLETAKQALLLKQKGEQAMEQGKQHGEYAVKAAEAGAGNSLNRVIAGMDADKAIEFKIRNKMNADPPIPLDKRDLDEASQVAYDKAKKDPKWSSIRSSAEKKFIQESDSGKSDLNKSVGISAKSGPDDYADAKVEQLIQKDVNRDIKSRYGNAEIRIGNQIHKVNEVIDQPEGSRAKLAVPAPKASSGSPVTKQAEAAGKYTPADKAQIARLKATDPTKSQADAEAAYDQWKANRTTTPVASVPPIPPVPTQEVSPQDMGVSP